ncbi:MAG: M3 family oligoendopeptidase [Bacteroidia bacterium]|nr:M3 family oligoendopeptidase [Bacteroidia bacterium]
MQEFLQIKDNKLARTFLPTDFEITDWESIKIYYDQLMEAEPDSVEKLEKYLKKRNELDGIVSEEYAWRYIRMTCNTQDEKIKEAFQFFVKEIIPHVSVCEDKLNRKLAANPYFNELDNNLYLTYTRQVKRAIEMFREANIPLSTEVQSLSQEYGSTMGAMTIEHEGKELTLQQAGKYMENRDQSVREEVWKKLAKRRSQDSEKLQELFDKLLQRRNQMAKNTGYDSYTRYKFDKMGRFDYQPADTKDFHNAVEKVVKPIYQELLQERRRLLGLSELRPWDLSVDIFGEVPLKPFEGADQLLERSVEALTHVQEELGEMIRIMDKKGFLDLDSRVGKAPGGYNYPLMETGIPFIFMNAAGTQTDVITMLHESGHAVHSFVTRNISLNALKQPPSEVAELASMSMELLCLDYYDAFYKDPTSLIRAKKGQLVRCITIFPWVATIDAFQQWLYDNPEHTHEERNAAFDELYIRFHGETVNWEGFEDIRRNLWLKQMHIFEVPFYYIEYAIAQLGALAVWRNFKQDPKGGLEQYLSALKLGYTRTIPEIYKEAGIRFDFSEDYMREAVEFCLKEYQDLSVVN